MEYQYIPIKEEMNKQDEEFLKEISPYYQKFAKNILRNYDLRNSLTKTMTNSLVDYNKTNLEIKNFLENRHKFLKNLAQYI